MAKQTTSPRNKVTPERFVEAGPRRCSLMLQTGMPMGAPHRHFFVCGQPYVDIVLSGAMRLFGSGLSCASPWSWRYRRNKGTSARVSLTLVQRALLWDPHRRCLRQKSPVGLSRPSRLRRSHEGQFARTSGIFESSRSLYHPPTSRWNI